MTLSRLMKNEFWNSANANAANLANEGVKFAKIAEIAFAKPQSEKVAELNSMLSEHPETRYAFLVEDDTTDPVICYLAIRGVGTCQLAIPLVRYDGLALVEAIAAVRAAMKGKSMAGQEQKPRLVYVPSDINSNP